MLSHHGGIFSGAFHGEGKRRLWPLRAVQSPAKDRGNSPKEHSRGESRDRPHSQPLGPHNTLRSRTSELTWTESPPPSLPRGVCGGAHPVIAPPLNVGGGEKQPPCHCGSRSPGGAHNVDLDSLDLSLLP